MTAISLTNRIKSSEKDTLHGNLLLNKEDLKIGPIYFHKYICLCKHDFKRAAVTSL